MPHDVLHKVVAGLALVPPVPDSAPAAELAHLALRAGQLREELRMGHAAQHRAPSLDANGRYRNLQNLLVHTTVATTPEASDEDPRYVNAGGRPDVAQHTPRSAK